MEKLFAADLLLFILAGLAEYQNLTPARKGKFKTASRNSNSPHGWHGTTRKQLLTHSLGIDYELNFNNT